MRACCKCKRKFMPETPYIFRCDLCHDNERLSNQFDTLDIKAARTWVIPKQIA